MAEPSTSLKAVPVSPDLATRHSDVNPNVTYVSAALPKIDWSVIEQSAPEKIPVATRQPDDPLPEADWVVITWTSAEWQALDHVFLNSNSDGAGSKEWKNEWLPYTRGASSFTADAKSGQLWGMFQMVQVTDQSNRPWRVLLFKSNAHLAHSPWIDGLSAMMKCILTDTKADRVYTIGTAGGARTDQGLGDSVITNNSIIELQRPQNTSDPANGNAFRCPTWYPATALLSSVQDKLLMKISDVATKDALSDLFNQLKAKHPGDKTMDAVQLDDLLVEGLDPVNLATPKIQSLKDVPLLTTDFYYIANGNSADAFSFLEMDDAIIAREANAMGVRFACIRNISDPVVPDKTRSGQLISDSIRGDWSGLIYSNFGLYTSFNGALATWATIAGEGSAGYNPKRSFASPSTEDALEVKLVFDVRSCGTCNFFWPDGNTKNVYGPYTSFSFDVNVPYPAQRPAKAATAPWVLGRTRPPSFPNGEVIDGCRKAPIMTIGINPNLTAFLPGQTGAAWAYPNFDSEEETNGWTKYAWYYRYRSVYQEKLSLDFVKRFVLPDGKITATKNGKVVSAPRSDENPSWKFSVRYDGDETDTIIELPGKTGDFPYMLLFDTYGPTSAFNAGDVIAAKIAVPQGIRVEVEQAQQTYYMQFLPTLRQFTDYLVSKGHTKAHLQIGEDVSQLDMVACASPHWTEGFLGNEMKTVVNNCVSKNAWAIKQFIQSRPAVLFIVSESSWNMFYSIMGNFVQGKISSKPVDQSFTLLRETTDPANPVYINLDTTIDGISYKSKTRLVITPHFSFDTNFYPQYRFSPEDFTKISALPDFAAAITATNGFTTLPEDKAHPTYYREIQLDPGTAAETRAKLKTAYPSLFDQLESYYYDAHANMSAVLQSMYDAGELSYNDEGNYLDRTEGACKFCVNEYWQFPNECRYGKPKEQQPPAGFLEKVAGYVSEKGKPSLQSTT